MARFSKASEFAGRTRSIAPAIRGLITKDTTNPETNEPPLALDPIPTARENPIQAYQNPAGNSVKTIINSPNITVGRWGRTRRKNPANEPASTNHSLGSTASRNQRDVKDKEDAFHDTLQYHPQPLANLFQQFLVCHDTAADANQTRPLRRPHGTRWIVSVRLVGRSGRHGATKNPPAAPAGLVFFATCEQVTSLCAACIPCFHPE